MPLATLDTLRTLAGSVEARAYVPYSRRPDSSAGLLSDGTWVPGVRIENASFPLLIPALLSVVCTTRAAGRSDLVAVVQTSPFSASDADVLTSAFGTGWEPIGGDVLIARRVDSLPPTEQLLDPFLSAPAPSTDAEGLALAARAAEHAHVPESDFPVGCVVEAEDTSSEDGRLVPGCNVEHADWTRGLCAERVALSTALSYGITTFRRLFLTCPKEPSAPCGACRQVLVELAAGVPVVMDRGGETPETTTPEALLPGAFGGRSLRA